MLGKEEAAQDWSQHQTEVESQIVEAVCPFPVVDRGEICHQRIVAGPFHLCKQSGNSQQRNHLAVDWHKSADEIADHRDQIADDDDVAFAETVRQLSADQGAGQLDKA